MLTDTIARFEDLPNGADFNCSNMRFLFTNVLINVPAKTGADVPEPGSLALLGLEIVGFAASGRKRSKSA